MRWTDRAARERMAVEHPLRTGFLWATVTVLVLAIVELLFRQRPVDQRWVVTHVIVFAVAGPLWGYATRWAILRRRQHAG